MILAKRGDMNEDNIVKTGERWYSDHWIVCWRRNIMSVGLFNGNRYWIIYNTKIVKSTQEYAIMCFEFLLEQPLHLFPFLEFFQPSLVNAFSTVFESTEAYLCWPVPHHLHMRQVQNSSVLEWDPKQEITVLTPHPFHPSCLARLAHIHE